MSKNTAISFGDFQIEVAMSKCASSRDLKTEYVNEAGEKVTMGGGTTGGSRTPAPGVEKAVRVSDKHVVRLPADELEAIEKGSKDRYETMTVLETIDYRQVPTERIAGSYWLEPRAGTAKGLRMLAEGLRGTGRVAVVKWVSSSREKLGVIRVRADDRARTKIALMLSELTFANDFAHATEGALAINEVEVAPSSLEAAKRLVKSYARPAPSRQTIDTASDEAVDARIALLERLHADAFERAAAQTALDESESSADEDLVKS